MSCSPVQAEVETAVADGRASSVVADNGSPVVDADEAACANCGELLAGDYCHRCGEKRPEARGLSARHFVAEAAR